MFITNTDWEFSDLASVTAAGEAMWPEMRAAGAVSFQGVQTGENTARTIITWPDAETAHAAIETLRATASKLADMRVVGAAAGAVIVSKS